MTTAVSGDQAAGLRQWAGQHKKDKPETQAVTRTSRGTIVVVGLPSALLNDTSCVRDELERYAQAGKQWVGSSDDWDIVVAESSPIGLAELAQQYQRWVLWVEPDLNGFQRAYYGLKTLQRAGAPKQVLLMHPPLSSTRGLVANVEAVAARFFGIRLLRIQLPVVKSKQES